MNPATVGRSMGYLVLGVALWAWTGNIGVSADVTAGPNLDANRLKTGRFLLRTLLNGKDAGRGEISIRKLQSTGHFIYTDREIGSYAQHWKAVATEGFVPISAMLAFGEGDNLPPAFELKYERGRVTGFRLARHSDASSKVNVEAQVSQDTVDQRIDWAAAMSQELISGRDFTFHVFDPGSGSSRVTGRIGGPESVSVPAGNFEAVRIIYRIEKIGGSEVYQELTNREGLRMPLKEEFPDGSVTELVETRD
jgi:hypothetical protein